MVTSLLSLSLPLPTSGADTIETDGTSFVLGGELADMVRTSTGNDFVCGDLCEIDFAAFTVCNTSAVASPAAMFSVGAAQHVEATFQYTGDNDVIWTAEGQDLSTRPNCFRQLTRACCAQLLAALARISCTAGRIRT